MHTSLQSVDGGSLGKAKKTSDQDPWASESPGDKKKINFPSGVTVVLRFSFPSWVSLSTCKGSPDLSIIVIVPSQQHPSSLPHQHIGPPSSQPTGETIVFSYFFYFFKFFLFFSGSNQDSRILTHLDPPSPSLSLSWERKKIFRFISKPFRCHQIYCTFFEI